MKLDDMKAATYGVRLYKMPSNGEIEREARLRGNSFANLKLEYETLWKNRHTLRKQFTV